MSLAASRVNMSSNDIFDFGLHTTEQNAESALGLSVGAMMRRTKSSSILDLLAYTRPSNPLTFSAERKLSQYALNGVDTHFGTGKLPFHGAKR
jgi:hypothetical protein